MRIAFLVSSCPPFSNTTVDDGPLGGTESGCIYMARSLAALGHDVTVYNAVTEVAGAPPLVYKPMTLLDRDAATVLFDVVVAVRDWWILFTPLRCRSRFLWTGDSFDVLSTFGIGDPRVYGRVRRIITVSGWQAEALSEKSRVPMDRFFVSRNGFWPEYGETALSEDRPLRFIYASTPDRGLDVLINLFPKIRERHPSAELHLYSSLQGYGRGPLSDTHPELIARLNQPGIRRFDGVSRRELMRAMAASYLMLYPAHFRETSCMAAIESQAVGTPVVTTALAALTETVRDGETGLLISGDARSSDYQSRFLDAVLGLVADRGRWAALSRAARKRMQATYSWQGIAAEWAELFRESMN